jgi:hypothetical protein
MHREEITMKFLLLLIISFSANASFLPESKIGQDYSGVKIFTKKSKCEKTYSPEKCLSIRETGNESFHKIKPDTQLKEQAQICSGESDCIEKYNALECSSEMFYKVRTAEHDETYCTKFEAAHIVEDATLKAAHDAAKAIKDGTELAVRAQVLDMDLGKKLYAQIMLHNKKKGSSKAQRKQMRKDFKDIRDDFFDGDICSAKDGVSAITPGVLITQDDIDSIIALINSAKTCS